MEGVALPMYDLPECRAATDALVGALAEATGLVQSEPSADRERARADQREMERLLDACPPSLTQMCGASLATRLESGASRLVPIGAPCYTVPGCDDGGVAVYRGIVVVRKADADAGRYTSLASLAGARLALNDVHSYSGCIALRAAVAPLLATHRDAYPVDARSGADAGCAGGDTSGADALADTRRALHFFHPEIVRTGSHRASLRAVTDADADVACVDCVTWALLADLAPDEVASLVQIGATPHAPAPPYVCAAATTDATRRSLLDALQAMPFAGGDLAAACSKLRLGSVAPAPPAEEYVRAFAGLRAAAAPVLIDEARARRLFSATCFLGDLFARRLGRSRAPTAGAGVVRGDAFP